MNACLFEKFTTERSEERSSQVLLDSVVVEFSPASADLVTEHLPTLRNLGFDVDGFGPGSFVIRSVPGMLQGSSPEGMLRAAVEDLEVDETPLEKNIEDKIIARVCKRAAVKAGQMLSPEEQKQLLLDLEACQSPRTCPHGRPTMIHLICGFAGEEIRPDWSDVNNKGLNPLEEFNPGSISHIRNRFPRSETVSSIFKPTWLV